MESPFTGFTGIEGNNYEEEQGNYGLMVSESPLLDPAQMEGKSVSPSDEVRAEYQVPPQLTTQNVGNISLAVADDSISSSGEYAEPVSSGNPLLIVTSEDRKKTVSKNFTVNEFARAQAGAHQFKYFRIDPALIDNLQRLRNFIGKPIVIIDGYYTPKYLKEVLKISDPLKINRNPHIKGQGVKISVAGYSGMVKQIAIAAIVVCDRDNHIGIGSATMTLAVKQPLPGPSDRDEDAQRIVSYIADERVKVATYTFCIDVKKILFNHAVTYQTPLHKALGALVVTILKFHFSQTVPPEWSDWETPLGNAISYMHNNSITKHPNVILYVIAYSPFGYLYRYYLKNKSNGSTEKYIIEDITTDIDKANTNSPRSFLTSLKNPDKSLFIETCKSRIELGRKPNGSAFRLVPETFFDWKDNKDDKNFMAKMTQFIRDVYVGNHYIYDIPPQQFPVGGTKSNVKLSDPNPDKPVVDFTGRYWSQNNVKNAESVGLYLLLNQAGNYISGKFGEIQRTTPVTDLRKTVKEFYGKVDDKGNGICTIVSQQTIVLKKDKQKLLYIIIDNQTDTVSFKALFVSMSQHPVISNIMLNAFSNINAKYRDLMVTLAWVYPPPVQLKEFFESFKKSELAVKDAVTKYYNEDETQPATRNIRLGNYVSALDNAVNNYLRLPNMFSQFANYYIRFFYSVSPHWKPRNDIETRSTLKWIEMMLEDYRDIRGTAYVESHHKWLYEYFGIDMKIPDIIYKYKLSIRLSAMGIGPFARSSGHIVIENKTDFAKYPAVADKWTKTEELPIVLWNATLSFNPLSWRPKISAGQNIEAEATSNAPYSPSNFSGADVQVTEGKVFEIPLSVNTGGVKVGTKIGIGGNVVLIDGKGKKTLEFTSDLDLGLPDTIEVEPSDDSAQEGTYEKIAGFLPSLTMYKGSIDTKETSADIVSVPLADSFTASYQIKDTRYFQHDDATLTAQAVEAIGRLCAEELVAFSNPASKIEIYGHTDASGDQGYNIDLSNKRALNVLQAIKDRLGDKLPKAVTIKTEGLGESEANKKYGEFTEKNAWLRKVVVILNGRAVLSLGEL